MSLLCEYFAAQSESDAALTVDWEGGPSRPTDGQHGYEVIALGGIEPVVLMGQLEGLLTGRSVMEVLDDPGHSPVAQRDGGERLVIPVGERLEAALASLDETRIPDIAASWARAEEFWGVVGPTDLVAPVTQLVALARKARAESQHVYCWMSV
jgi:hypothetical protein